MLRLSLAFSILGALLFSTAAHGQIRANLNRATTETSSRATVDARAIAALTRLDQLAIVHRSRGDFEESGKLARVALPVFEQVLRKVEVELQPILNEMPPNELRHAIMNALDSYRDGAYWWRQIDQPRVINVSALAPSNPPRTAADAVFLSTVPYTVAIHWRRAHDYLKQAERINSQS
jgi:hypothetical protein